MSEDFGPEVGEAVERIASLASSIERDVITTIADIRRSWAELAAHLYAANEHSAWLALGYETLDEWLAQPEIDLGRRYFLQLVETYRVLHIEHGINVNEIGRVDVTKAIVVLAAVRREQIAPEAALADAESLSRTDLREKYRDLLPDPQNDGKSFDPDDFHFETCPTCGHVNRVRDT